MPRLDIRKILKPMDEDLPNEPSISVGSRVTEAIEGMLRSNLSRIAVKSGEKVIGMIQLEDALKKIGLEPDLKSTGR